MRCFYKLEKFGGWYSEIKKNVGDGIQRLKVFVEMGTPARLVIKSIVLHSCNGIY